MRLLFDSHFLIAIVNGTVTPTQTKMLEACGTSEIRYASTASLWEIAIKHRLRKLHLTVTLSRLPELIESYDFSLLDIDRRHVMETLRDMPQTKDPFDQLLLAQCQVEGLRLVTTDRVLAAHPLAWREA